MTGRVHICLFIIANNPYFLWRNTKPFNREFKRNQAALVHPGFFTCNETIYIFIYIEVYQLAQLYLSGKIRDYGNNHAGRSKKFEQWNNVRVKLRRLQEISPITLLKVKRQQRL